MDNEDHKDNFRIVPIRHVDVYTAAREQLTELIENGGYQVGDKLPSERDLAAQLVVSRNIIREAMKVLEATGRVEILHGAGTFIRKQGQDPIAEALRGGQEFTEAFLRELIDVRAAIEVKIIALAVERATDTDLKRLRLVIDRLEREHLPDREVGSLNVSFEAALGEATANPMLRRLQTSVHQLWVEAWGSLHIAPGTKHSLHGEHVQMYEAVLARDAATATGLMHQHIERFVSPKALVAGSHDDQD